MYLTDMYVYVLVGICVSKMYYCSHMLKVKNFQKLSSTTTDKLTFYVSRDFILVWWGRESDKMYDNRILERSPPPPSYSYPPEMVNNYCTLSYVVIFCKTIFLCQISWRWQEDPNARCSSLLQQVGTYVCMIHENLIICLCCV